MSTTVRERAKAKQDRQTTVEYRRQQVRLMRAQGMASQDIAEVLGIHVATVYRDLEAFRAQALEESRLDPEAEARKVQERLDAQLADVQEMRRVLRTRTEPGTSQYAQLAKALTDAERTYMQLLMELGIVHRAPDRILLTDTRELAGLVGEELQERLAELEERERQLLGAMRARKAK